MAHSRNVTSRAKHKLFRRKDIIARRGRTPIDTSLLHIADTAGTCQRLRNIHAGIGAQRKAMGNPIEAFSLETAFAAVAKRYNKRYGVSKYKPHQGAQECARRVAHR